MFYDISKDAPRAHRAAGMLIVWSALAPVAAALLSVLSTGGTGLVAVVMNGMLYPFFIAAPAAALCARFHGTAFSDFRGFCARHAILGILCCACMWPGAMAVSSLADTDVISAASSMAAMRAMGPLLSALLLAVLPAVAEEFLVRGFLYGVFAKHGAAWGILASSACFALLHGDPVQAAYAFYCGLFLGLLRFSTGGMSAGIIAHMLFNLSTVVAVFLNDNIQSGPAASGLPVWILAIAACGIAIAWQACAFERRRSGIVSNSIPGWPAATAWSAGGALAAAFFAAALRW